MEDVICNYLLPLAEEQLTAASIENSDEGEKQKEKICGFEWWVHTRPIHANLGHNLHFDTDESLLAQDKKITHPVLSSVLYLTGDETSGATVVFDQTPDSDKPAQHAWRCVPKDNSYMTFPGNLLHGVLPCPGKKQKGDEKSISKNVDSEKSGKRFLNVSELWKDAAGDDQKNDDESKEESPHRLTLLVWFWSRRVPDQMKERKLYGPCGPIPPAEDTQWVQCVQEGYPQEKEHMSEHDNSDQSIKTSVDCVLSFHLVETVARNHPASSLHFLPLLGQEVMLPLHII